MEVDMRRKILVLLVLITTLVAFGPADAASPIWAEYGKDSQNSGLSSYVGPANTDNTWTLPLDYYNNDSFASPVVDATGTIYLIDGSWGLGYWIYVDGQRQWIETAEGDSLKAVSSSGELIWNKDMGGICVDEYGTTSLALGTNDVLYAVCGSEWELVDEEWYRVDPRVFAIDTVTGNTTWEVNLTDHEIGGMGALTIDSLNRLYIVSLLDKLATVTSISEAGTILWSESYGESNTYIDSLTGGALSPDESTIYVYRQDRWGSWPTYWRGAVVDAISTETGEVNWRLPLKWGGTGWQLNSSFTVDGNGTIWLASYVKDDPDRCYSTAENLVGISPDGAISYQWHLDGDLNCGTHLSVGPSGTIYVTYDDIYRGEFKGGLAAFDPDLGFKWRFELPDSYEANAYPAIDADENIYFAAGFGERLYSINKDGELNWMYDIAPGVEPDERRNRYREFDEFPYGPAIVIGKGGSIHVMSSENLYTVVGATEDVVINVVEELILSGELSGNAGETLSNTLEQAIAAPTTEAQSNVLNATVNQINALERSGRLDSVRAEELRTLIGQIQ